MRDEIKKSFVDCFRSVLDRFDPIAKENIVVKVLVDWGRFSVNEITTLTEKLAEARKEIESLKKSLSDAQAGWAKAISCYAGKVVKENTNG